MVVVGFGDELLFLQRVKITQIARTNNMRLEGKDLVIFFEIRLIDIPEKEIYQIY